jgi:hypothetical protein
MKASSAPVRLSLLVMSAAVAVAQAAGDARLVLPDLHSLETKASDVVNVTIDSSLLAMAARFLDPSKPEDAAAQQAIAGITGIYVRSYTFDSDFAYPTEDLNGLRKQLTSPGWQPVVQVHSRKDHNDVDVYIRVDGSKTNGLAIIASDPRDITIVNIVGAVDLRKLHDLEGHFGIPQLKMDDKK